MNDDTVKISKADLDKLIEYASEFNMTIQGAFIEMMRKMHDLEIEGPEGRILVGNYGPIALGAAIAAIMERYEEDSEEEFWGLLMGKYSQGRQVLGGTLEDEEAAKERGVTVIEMVPTILDKNTTKH